jgi:GT2 family glycosyltransferase
VADDGSGDAPAVSPPAVLVHLPKKDHALNPCTAFNAGADFARGDLLVLTNPEIVHREPILEQMRDELNQLGPKGYVAASCWDAKSNSWYCHSALMVPRTRSGRAPMPAGAGLHFCSMLRAELFDQVGGFSEEYRDGQGYEDNDFLWKLHAAGAKFRICDNLTVDHIECPRTEWPAGGTRRNRMIFEQKFPNAGS